MMSTAPTRRHASPERKAAAAARRKRMRERRAQRREFRRQLPLLIEAIPWKPPARGGVYHEWSLARATT